MINKPVSVIMNASGGAYDSTNHVYAKGIYYAASKTLDYFMENANVGQICFIDAGTKYMIDPFASGAKLADHKEGIRIYQKLTNDKFIRLASQKPLKQSDIFNINYIGCRAGNDFVVMLKDFCYDCNGEYGIRFEVQNDELYQQQFKNMYTESYVVPADKCCGVCNNSDTPDAAVIALKLYEAWYENRKHSMVDECSFIVVDPGSSSTLDDGDTISAEDLEKLIEDGNTDGVKVGVVWKVKPTQKYTYGQMNFKYMKNRITTMKASKLSDLQCGGTIVDNRTADIVSDAEETPPTYFSKFVVEQTSGYDLKQMEYDFMGWMNESPYRLSDVTLSEMGHEYKFEQDKIYSVLTISYEQQSDAPWGHWQHPEQLVIAADCTESGGSLNDNGIGYSTTQKYLKNLAAFFEVTVANGYDTVNVDFK